MNFIIELFVHSRYETNKISNNDSFPKSVSGRRRAQDLQDMRPERGGDFRRLMDLTRSPRPPGGW